MDMRYWAAGFLLTVLLFGGALLGAGKDTGTVPGQSAADGAVLLRVWAVSYTHLTLPTT